MYLFLFLSEEKHIVVTVHSISSLISLDYWNKLKVFMILKRILRTYQIETILQQSFQQPPPNLQIFFPKYAKEGIQPRSSIRKRFDHWRTGRKWRAMLNPRIRWVTREKERSGRSMANYVGSARLPCASGADVYLRSMGAQDGSGAPLPFIHRARNRYAAGYTALEDICISFSTRLSTRQPPFISY